MAWARVLLRRIPRSGTVYPMSELMRLIQSHLDRYGVTRATFAKRIGTTPQTVQNWKTRSTTMPKADVLKGVAKETKVPYLIVLDAALKDAGYRDSLADDFESLKVRIARYVRASERGVWELQDYLTAPYIPGDREAAELTPSMTEDDFNALIDRYIAEADTAEYGNSELFDRELLLQWLAEHTPEEPEDDLEADPPPRTPTEGGSPEEVKPSQEPQVDPFDEPAIGDIMGTKGAAEDPREDGADEGDETEEFGGGEIVEGDPF